MADEQMGRIRHAVERTRKKRSNDRRASSRNRKSPDLYGVAAWIDGGAPQLRQQQTDINYPTPTSGSAASSTVSLLEKRQRRQAEPSESSSLQRRLSDASTATTTNNAESLEQLSSADEHYRRVCFAVEHQRVVKRGDRRSMVESERDMAPWHIEIGRWKMAAWYQSFYPIEYAESETLYLCNDCLAFYRTRQTLEHHVQTRRGCLSYVDIGHEIYRSADEALSVYHVDGRTMPHFCQLLCMLAKLFLGEKERLDQAMELLAFQFFIAVENDAAGGGRQFVGYFSRERDCRQGRNLSCFVVLPPFRNSGYGRFLIELSYELSKRERRASCGPELPLSELGEAAYGAYWRVTIARHLLDAVVVGGGQDQRSSSTTIVLADLQQLTGMTLADIVRTLVELELLDTGSCALRSLRFDTSHAKRLRDLVDRDDCKRAVTRRVDSARLVWKS